MTSLRDETTRRRLELYPLTTSVNSGRTPGLQLQTPNSAASFLSTPFGYNSSSYTPTPVSTSAVREYNPQQWASPSAASDHSNHFRPRIAVDQEVLSSAPPPYSPPRSQRSSTIISSEDPSSAAGGAIRIQHAGYRTSPDPASNPVFPPPPPPGNRNRAAGSNDRPPTLFNISSFARRHVPDRISPELGREPVPSARRFTPNQVQSPELIATEVEIDHVTSTNPEPPASRRAVSAGAVSTPSSSRSRGSSSTRWEPGMPLPPPPPGPPPQSRSQSMSRTPDRVLSPPVRRPLASTSTLGPVPPTPAGWVEETMQAKARSPNEGLHIDTSSITSSVNSSTAADSNSGSSSSGLTRSHAVRGEKTIRERRSESRSGRSVTSTDPLPESIIPSDIVLPQTGLTRRPTITKSTPRSAGRRMETPKSSELSQRNTPLKGSSYGDSGSRGSTPRPLVSSSCPETPTPPFSPHKIRDALLQGSPSIPPRALPTPPPQSWQPPPPGSPHPQQQKSSNNDPPPNPPQNGSRPNSMQAPGSPFPGTQNFVNIDSPVHAPLSISRPTSRQSNANKMPQLSPAEQFARAAIDRHKAFAEKEAAATTDGERVRVFADFIVTESRLRRERYANAIDAMGSEILELTRDLFRPYSSPRRESTTSNSGGWTPESSAAPRSHRGSLNAALHGSTPLSSEPASGSAPPSPALARPETTWWNGYKPSLSPIPSMSVSEALDGESSSRGRPSSRWWEVSQYGSDGAASMRLEQRTKRESKYMGMPRELREALQFESGEQASETANKDAIGGPSEGTHVSANEYPPEKVGWHEQGPTSPPTAQIPSKSPSPFSPNPNHLDVSRLVTLPPSYPRHHPAVNNNHPDLTSIRTIVRVLSDFTEVEAVKERFTKTSTQVSEEFATAASKRRNSLRANIQREIECGNMSYSDAAKVEAASVASEAEKTKEAAKVDFELFQSQVVLPLNDLIMERVNRATTLFSELRSKLFNDARQQSPNLTQEEGDEQPELLEKLTLLKWIFEAREQLHRELFDLLSDRNNRYRDVVTIPYRLAGNEEKVRNAEAFFSEDTGKRKLDFEQEILKRTEEFMDVIEENVVRGVEVQLSAFWDIAPSLRNITEKVPQDLNGFQIQIPAAEYQENPAYDTYPMQYLYSLMCHSEKSTYQFIESQTNLLCLLHEVKSGVTVANCRLMETQRVAQGEREEDVKRELKAVEADEERRLTDDLKEKVRTVEDQWTSALGKDLMTVKERIKNFLMEQGGWEEEGNSL